VTTVIHQKNYRQLLHSLKHKCIVQSPPHRVAHRRTHVRVLGRRSSFFEAWSPSCEQRRLVQVHARARPTYQNRIFHRVSHLNLVDPHTTFRTASMACPCMQTQHANQARATCTPWRASKRPAHERESEGKVHAVVCLHTSTG
jgi:hypothetical protein